MNGASTRTNPNDLKRDQHTYCPICKRYATEKMLIHLATHHKGVVQASEMFWLNKHDVIYNGRLYERE